MRRRFLLRMAAFATVVFVLAVGVPIVLVWHLLSAIGLSAPVAGIAAFSVATVLLAGAAWTAGNVRAIALPLGDLIEAAGRLEAGDYAIRVDERRRGPPELRSLARAFNAMAARLEADERQRRTLLADVSHELRTPLAVLQGELEAIVDGVHPPDAAHLAGVLEETAVLTRLVEDLRTLALAETGALTLHREPTDLGVVAADVAAGFETLAEPSGARVELDVAEPIPLADVDPVRVRQVLTNLLANAVRYAPPGSSVRVRVTSAGHLVVVEVADSGPGIPPDLLPHVFDRFAKSSDSRGSGLGLAIASRLVEAHAGRIEASRPEGGGTLVRFELPIEPPAA